MTKIRLTRRFQFEAAHALQNYKGPCRNIHGHSYKLEVTVIGVPLVEEAHTENGMVMNFRNMKKLVQNLVLNQFDHTLLADSSPELIQALQN